MGLTLQQLKELMAAEAGNVAVLRQMAEGSRAYHDQLSGAFDLFRRQTQNLRENNDGQAIRAVADRVDFHMRQGWDTVNALGAVYEPLNTLAQNITDTNNKIQGLGYDQLNGLERFLNMLSYDGDASQTAAEAYDAGEAQVAQTLMDNLGHDYPPAAQALAGVTQMTGQRWLGGEGTADPPKAAPNQPPKPGGPRVPPARGAPKVRGPGGVPAPVTNGQAGLPVRTADGHVPSPVGTDGPSGVDSPSGADSPSGTAGPSGVDSPSGVPSMSPIGSGGPDGSASLPSGSPDGGLGTTVDPTTGDRIDPATGKLIDPTTGDLIDPATGKLIDPTTGDLIDPTTGKLIDPTTGDLIDPTTGKLIDPTTGEPVGAGAQPPGQPVLAGDPSPLPTATPVGTIGQPPDQPVLTGTPSPLPTLTPVGSAGPPLTSLPQPVSGLSGEPDPGLPPVSGLGRGGGGAGAVPVLPASTRTSFGSGPSGSTPARISSVGSPGEVVGSTTGAMPIGTDESIASGIGPAGAAAASGAARGATPPYIPPMGGTPGAGGRAGGGVKPGVAPNPGAPALGGRKKPDGPEGAGVSEQLRGRSAGRRGRGAAKRRRPADPAGVARSDEVLDEHLWRVDPPPSGRPG